ncbi:hypothetical protein JW916_00805 [Candidatus Sumerlaeota bacterium]|nr:hypothetical protein [Candidatus Sumerlaeota bacterium]
MRVAEGRVGSGDKPVGLIAFLRSCVFLSRYPSQELPNEGGYGTSHLAKACLVEHVAVAVDMNVAESQESQEALELVEREHAYFLGPPEKVFVPRRPGAETDFMTFFEKATKETFYARIDVVQIRAKGHCLVVAEGLAGKKVLDEAHRFGDALAFLFEEPFLTLHRCVLPFPK